jgi:group I intron endonuclease
MMFSAVNPPERRAGIYAVTDTRNDKRYIGISNDMARRYSEHSESRTSTKKLREAVKAAPAEAFLFEPLFYLVGDLDYEYLMLWESDLIRVNNSVIGGYNARESSGRGRAPGAEFGAAISRALAKPEEKARRSAASKTARNNPEAKRKHAEKMRMWHRENKDKVLLTNRKNAALVSERTREAMKRPDVVAKMKAGNANPVTRQKRSDSAKKMSENQDVRRMRSEATKAAWANPEARMRRAEAIKAGLAKRKELMYGSVAVTNEVTTNV